MVNFSDYNVVVIGAGLAGSICARHFADKGKKVLVVERRNHIAGNLYDYIDENGILVQKYGPHCFHTDSEEVYEFINKYSEWYSYVVNCNVYMRGCYTPSPFNFKTLDQYYDKNKAKIIKDNMEKEYPNRKSVTIVEMLNSKNPFVKEYADFLYVSDYSLYTAKQWGIHPKDVDPNVLKRVPVLMNYDEQYFYDKYQIMPKHGFTEFIKNILNSSNINIELNFDIMKIISYENNDIYLDNKKYDGIVVYTGEIDRLFDYKYGKLPYRSLRFENETLDTCSYQSAPIVAYPEVEGYTRITEYTKMPYQNNTKTVIVKEYPEEYSDHNEPYYPINSLYNDKIHDLYKILAKDIKNLILCGRLAKYKYYNMDQAILDTLDVLIKCKG